MVFWGGPCNQGWVLQVQHVGRELPVTMVLANILEKAFPAEYAERRAETQGLGQSPGQESPLPLFVMSCILPGTAPPKSVSPCACGHLLGLI